MLSSGMHTRTVSARALPLVAALLVSVLVGCVTPPSQREGAVDRLLTRIAEGGAQERMALSALPFVLDQEIIMVERDLRTMWEQLTEAGFSLRNAELRSLDYGHDALYEAFGETMDMEVYFDRYAPEDVSVARVATDEGAFVLILGERERFAPVLHGLKGPVE